jgi:DNA-binding transcriptional regulator LsrR (DeoR family)
MARGAGVIGVAWGRNVNRVVKTMNMQPGDPSKVVLPVAGEPFKYRAAKVGATDAAHALAQKFGTRNVEHLLGVGARLPSHLAGAENVATIRAYLASSPSYQRIFGPVEDPKGPLIDRLDMVLTGIGSTSTSEAAADPLYLETVEAEAAKDSSMAEPTLQEAAIGNVAGWYLPKNVNNEAHCRVVERVNAHWFGIGFDSLRKCARRASSARPVRPGVVVVAAEPAKAEPVLAAVRAGIVSHLIVSRDLAEGLLVASA